MKGLVHQIQLASGALVVVVRYILQHRRIQFAVAAVQILSALAVGILFAVVGNLPKSYFDLDIPSFVLSEAQNWTALAVAAGL